jgi:hypothetical protein
MGRLIDAEKAKKALMGWVTEPTDEEIEYTIDRIPTVEAVPVVRGEWRSIITSYCYVFECSNCGKIEEFDTNFCPNCGADMRKEKK